MFEVDKISFNYERKNILNNVNFLLNPGLVSLMGPNGSGKSTLIKILSGMLRQNSGEIKYFGKTLTSMPNYIRKNLGVLFQNNSHDDRLSAYENLVFFARLYGLKNYQQKINYVLEYANLGSYNNTPVKKFSGGMKRRLELYRTFMHEPKIILLDEPTEGLDDHETKKFLDFIKEYQNKHQALIFYASHRSQEISFAEQVIMLNSGELMYQGCPQKLISSLDFEKLYIKSVWNQENKLKKLMHPYVRKHNFKKNNFEYKIRQEDLKKIFNSQILFSPIIKSHRVDRPSIHDAFYEQREKLEHGY